MRKSIIVFMVLILLLLASCLPETPEPPFGVWMSEEPRIVLYLKPEYRLPIAGPNYLGTYTIDGVDRKVFVSFGPGLSFALYDLTEPRAGGRMGGVSHSGSPFGGTYRVVRDEIHVTITLALQERLGLETRTIIFRRVEDHDPIDPYYWFPYFFPRHN